MTIVAFLIILAILVFVHELGHFLAAKLAGIRVDEFAIGFPPRIFSRKIGETNYALNIVPFGGYVKIFGENPDEDSMRGLDAARSFVNKPKFLQAMVLSAGVIGNIVLAWLLISLGFMVGMPTPVVPETEAKIHNPQVIVTSVAPDSPAAVVGLRAGDAIVSLSVTDATLPPEKVRPETVQSFIALHAVEEITIELSRQGRIDTVRATPVEGIIPDRAVLGISMDYIGLLRLPLPMAVIEGATFTYELTMATVVGLSHFITDAFRGQADLKDVTGPVGIAGLVGEAQALGFVYLLTFTALISINLAIINLIPFPALDGGRILFVAIEAVRGRALTPKIANAMNGIGFMILIIFMLVITYRDIGKLVTGS